MGVIVREVPLFLHRHKGIAEVLNILWELAEDIVSARAGSSAVIQGPVCLPPGMLALGCAFSTDQEVGTGACEPVEQGVVGGTGGSPQVDLRRLAAAAIDQQLGRFDQITRPQLSASSHLTGTQSGRSEN